MDLFETIGNLLDDTASIEKLKKIFVNPHTTSQLIIRLKRLLNELSPVKKELEKNNKLLKLEGSNNEHFGKIVSDLDNKANSIKQNINHILKVLIPIEITARDGSVSIKNIKMGDVLKIFAERKALTESSCQKVVETGEDIVPESTS